MDWGLPLIRSGVKFIPHHPNPELTLSGLLLLPERDGNDHSSPPATHHDTRIIRVKTSPPSLILERGSGGELRGDGEGYNPFSPRFTTLLKKIGLPTE